MPALKRTVASVELSAKLFWYRDTENERVLQTYAQWVDEEVDHMTRDGVLVKSITHVDDTDPTLVKIQERWAQDVCYATQGMFA
jgi:hypothetical protein